MRLKDIEKGAEYLWVHGYRGEQQQRVRADEVGVHAHVYRDYWNSGRSDRATFVLVTVLDSETGEVMGDAYGQPQTYKVPCQQIRRPWDQQEFEQRQQAAREAKAERKRDKERVQRAAFLMRELSMDVRPSHYARELKVSAKAAEHLSHILESVLQDHRDTSVHESTKHLPGLGGEVLAKTYAGDPLANLQALFGPVREHESREYREQLYADCCTLRAPRDMDEDNDLRAALGLPCHCGKADPDHDGDCKRGSTLTGDGRR